MKKIFWVFFLLLIILSFASAHFANAKVTNSAYKGLVTCDGPDCTIEDFFDMLDRIFRFIVYDIAAPLAILALIIGGVLLLISAGNPRLAELGKKTLYAAVIGLFLVLCSWLIINIILTTIGYKANWNIL